MLSKFVNKFLLLGILTTLLSCSSRTEPPLSTPTPSTSSNTEVIVIGDVSNNPAKKIQRYQPMADYLGTKLNQFNIGIGEVKVAPDFKIMAKWLKAGEVDIYFDSLYPAMIVSELSEAKPILRRWKKGSSDYYTIFFTMKNNGINSLADLKGKIIAFDDNRSTSGYMLPLAYLIEANLNPVEKNSEMQTVKTNEVGYIFSDDDENSIQWVISKKVNAAAVDNQTFLEIPEETRAQMVILGQTEKVPRQVVVVRPDIDPQLLAEIKTIFTTMHENPEGQETLKLFERTTKLDEFPIEGNIDRMRELYELVQNY